MLSITLLSLYLLSIKITYTEIKKKEKLTSKKLKADGYITEDLNKIKIIFKILQFTPFINMYSVSLFNDNFDEAYKELKLWFLKNNIVTESPLLIEVDYQLKKLMQHEYEIMKNSDITSKVKYIERRKNKKLFSENIDLVNMDIEEQEIFIRKEKEKSKLDKLITEQFVGEPNSDEKLVYLNNMRRFFTAEKNLTYETDIKKVKQR